MAGLSIFSTIICCGSPGQLSTRLTATDKFAAGHGSGGLVLDVQTAGGSAALLQRLQTPGQLLPAARSPASAAIAPAAVEDAELAEHAEQPLLASALKACALPPGHHVADEADQGEPTLSTMISGVDVAIRRPDRRTMQLHPRAGKSASNIAFAGLNPGQTDAPAAFADPEQGAALCDDITMQLHNMNIEAAANGRPPYRLWVEGHVSVALHGAAHARRLSRKRAQLCASLIRTKLQDLDAELTPAHANGLVVAVGMGHTMPLLGLDDGGNYAENRRVEFHVQQLTGEGDEDDAGTGAHYSIEVFHQPLPKITTSSI